MARVVCVRQVTRDDTIKVGVSAAALQSVRESGTSVCLRDPLDVVLVIFEILLFLALIRC